MDLYQEPSDIGKHLGIENCTDCHVPTRLWTNKGEDPLCAPCAYARDGVLPTVIRVDKNLKELDRMTMPLHTFQPPAPGASDLTEYRIGVHTEHKVIRANGITDLSDLQALLTAVERSHRKANAELVAMRRERDDLRDLLKGIATNITKAIAPAPGTPAVGNLDQGAPNHTDHSQRGFTPK